MEVLDLLIKGYLWLTSHEHSRLFFMEGSRLFNMSCYPTCAAEIPGLVDDDDFNRQDGRKLVIAYAI